MFRVDYHVHTNFSSDSFEQPECMVLSAIDKGLSEIAITDHVDLNYPPVSYRFWESFDKLLYEKTINALKEKYAERITILRGVELGLQPCSKPQIDAFMKDSGFDFVIGSTHVVDCLDLADGQFAGGKSGDKAIKLYFEAVLNTVLTFDNFDVYGHLDLITRYVRHTKPFSYCGCSGIIDEVLTAIIKKGKGLEVNTSGVRYGLGHFHPQYDIVKRYRDLGGEIITTASDAHMAGDVAYGFDDLYKMLLEAGFKAVTVFKGRKPVQTAI
jgi:histidinol-phosphatase (PHP family)